MASMSAISKPLVVLEHDDDDLIEDSENGVPPYTYDPLPDAHHFRVIELLPGEQNSRLECHITSHLLDDAQRVNYRAISYTWMESPCDNLVVSGKRAEFPGPRATYLIQHPIWCEGRRLLISTNLRDALRRFRHATIPQKFWIDAICINQQDLAERSHQVVLMPRIYHNSIAVWFWLGESDEGADYALSWINRLDQVFQTLPEDPSRLDIHDTYFMLGIGLHPIDSRSWMNLVDLFRRPVFQRMWIVQEIVTARKVIARCGPWFMDYELIQRVINYLARLSWDEELSSYYSSGENFFHYINVIGKIESEWRDNRYNVRQRLVLATRNFQATDPKDKIFALLGLFNDFAHREACHLGLCDATHQTASSILERGTEEGGIPINTTWHEDSEWGRIGRAISNALRELVSHEAESRVRKIEEEDARLLYQASESDEQISATRTHLIRYLRSLLYQNLRDIKGFFGLDENEPVAADIQQWLDGEDSKYLMTNKESVEFLDMMVKQETDDSSFKTISSFVIHVMNTVGMEFSKADQLKTGDDVAALWASQLFVYQRRLIHFLQLILSTSATPVSESVDEIVDGMQNLDIVNVQVPFCDTPHGRPFDHDSGQICISHMHGRYAVFCSSFDEDFFVPAIESVARSNAPPNAGCSLSEDSWRLVKAFVGDLSQWIQESSKEFFRGTMRFSDDAGQPLDIPPTADAVLDMQWLTRPLESYLEHGHHPRSRTSPLQHWSWSDNISRMPDYQLPINEVYREFTLRCLHDDPDLFVLSTIESGTTRMADLPSWVPDYSLSISHNMLLFPELDVKIPYYAAGDSKVEISWTPEQPDVLNIKGCKIDYIRVIAESGEGDNVFRFARDDEEVLHNLPDIYPTGGTKADALWRTFIANCTNAPEYTYPAPEEFGIGAQCLPLFEASSEDEHSQRSMSTIGTPPPPPPDRQITIDAQDSFEESPPTSTEAQLLLPQNRHPSPPPSAQSYEPQLLDPAPIDGTESNNSDAEAGPEDNHSITSSESSPDDIARRLYWEAANKASTGRHFFITEKGLFGLAPSSAQKGDQICIFAGGRLPYIIRSIPSSVADSSEDLNSKPNRTYTFIGESYCHGICSGQALHRDDFCWENIQLS